MSTATPLSELSQRYERILKERAVEEAIAETARSKAAQADREAYINEIGMFSGISEPLYLKLRECREHLPIKLFEDLDTCIQQQLLVQHRSFQLARHDLEKDLSETRAELGVMKANAKSYELLPAAEPINGVFIAPPERSIPSSSASYSHRLSLSDRKALFSSMQGSAMSRLGRVDSSKIHPSSPGSIARGTLGKEMLGVHLHLQLECVATLINAQYARLFLFDSHNNLAQVAEFPRHLVGAPTLDDTKTGHRRWARSIRTVANRNMAIVGYSVPQDELIERDGASIPQSASECDRVTSYMCWPIRSQGSPSIVRGVIEVINKNGYPTGKSFTADDEALLHHTAKSIGTFIGRYPLEHLDSIRNNAPKVLATLLQGSNSHHVADAPFEEYVKSAQNIINEAIQTELALPVFRGTMNTILTSQTAVESVSSKPSPVQSTPPSHSSHLSSQPSSTVDYHWEQPSHLTRIDYTLDSLSSMWRQEHDENVAMHEQVRYWSGRVRALTDMTKCFTEAIAKAKSMRTIEEVQTYLRTLDLSVRTTNVDTFLATVAGEGDEEIDIPETRTVLNSRRIEYVDEGPPGVRSFTLDPQSKRQQQRDIAHHIEHFKEIVASERASEKVATAHFSRSTVISSSRELPRRPSWQIEQRNRAFELKRVREREARVGVPPVSKPFNVARPLDNVSPKLALPTGMFHLPAPPKTSKDVQ